MVRKDVLRTDRQHKFYSGENNENINALYNILTTFALHHPSVGYCQVILFSFWQCHLLNFCRFRFIVTIQVKTYFSFTLSNHTLITLAHKVT